MDKAKDLYKLQKQAKQIKKELKNIHIEAEAEGVAVVMDGEQHCINITIDESLSGNVKGIEKASLLAFNKGIKKSQQIGAEKMKETMGDFGGMFGS